MKILCDACEKGVVYQVYCNECLNVDSKEYETQLSHYKELLGELFDEIFCMEAEGVEFMSAAERLKAINKKTHEVYDKIKAAGGQ
jgi:hypothetical protein